MKKKKLNFVSAHAILSKKQMKAISAGSGHSCTGVGGDCDTEQQLNCCSGLVCQDHECVES